jgi:hypothetical protein
MHTMDCNEISLLELLYKILHSNNEILFLQLNVSHNKGKVVPGLD